MRAYCVGFMGMEADVFAATAGKAKYQRLLDIRESFPDAKFSDLTCRSLGDITVPPTKTQLAQAAADAFNEIAPVGTMVRYWSWLKEGEPTGTGEIYHEATVVCENAVAWIEGARACHSITHVEPI